MDVYLMDMDPCLMEVKECLVDACLVDMDLIWLMWMCLVVVVAFCGLEVSD